MPAATNDVEEVGRRVEQLLDDLTTQDPTAARLAEDLVRSLVQLYGEGLLRILDRLYDAEPGAIHELAEDPLVGGLLALHDLHPTGVTERIEAALDECRPYLASHGGDVTLLGVDDDGTVQLRLEGTCDGCAASQVTLQTSVETAVLAAAPEVARIEVAGAVPLGEGHAPPPGVQLPPTAGDGPAGNGTGSGRQPLPMFQQAGA